MEVADGVGRLLPRFGMEELGGNVDQLVPGCRSRGRHAPTRGPALHGGDGTFPIGRREDAPITGWPPRPPVLAGRRACGSSHGRNGTARPPRSRAPGPSDRRPLIARPARDACLASRYGECVHRSNHADRGVRRRTSLRDHDPRRRVPRPSRREFYHVPAGSRGNLAAVSRFSFLPRRPSVYLCRWSLFRRAEAERCWVVPRGGADAVRPQRLPASQKQSPSRAAPTAIHSRGHLARIRRLTRSETGPAPLLAILQSIRPTSSFIAQQALLLSISLRRHARCRLTPKSTRLDSFQRRSDRLQLVVSGKLDQ